MRLEAITTLGMVLASALVVILGQPSSNGLQQAGGNAAAVQQVTSLQAK